MVRPWIEPRTSDLRVWCPTDCSTRPGDISENEVKDIINSLDINQASVLDLVNHKMHEYVSNSVPNPLPLFLIDLQEKKYSLIHGKEIRWYPFLREANVVTHPIIGLFLFVVLWIK